MEVKSIVETHKKNRFFTVAVAIVVATVHPDQLQLLTTLKNAINEACNLNYTQTPKTIAQQASWKKMNKGIMLLSV